MKKNQFNSKKAQIQMNMLSAGLISLVIFTLIVILSISLITTTKKTSIICPTSYDQGVCYDCGTNFRYNATGYCCSTVNTSNCIGSNGTAAGVYGGSGYNATLYLGTAAILPAQFSSIIIIALICVGIIGMVGFIGYRTYEKMKK